MYDALDLVREIKTMSKSERESADPMDYEIGKVISISPLAIKTDSNITLDEDFLVVPQRLTDYETEVEIDWYTENEGGGAGYAEFASHKHEIKGIKKVKVLAHLKEGDNVILIRQDGGQEFLVYDRLGD